MNASLQAEALAPARTVNEVLAQSQVHTVIDELERDLVGLVPVKQRIRDIAALQVIDKLRANLGLARTEVEGRNIRYRISSYATDRPEGERYE